ncbi:MAG: hypothetical protein IJS39_13715 [Synergistaceae bacterium]|nr:hypothetical protein [Synergistaceae bacterium]
MAGLIRGEILLTVHIVLGLVLGEVITRLRLPEKLLSRIAPILRVNPVTALAVASSIASSKTGAAMLSSAYSQGAISEKCAVWSVLMLSFPAYLRRWPSTLIMSVSMAGKAGGIYALAMLAITAGRFLTAYMFVVSENAESPAEEAPSHSLKTPSLKTSAKRAMKLLPVAWLCYGLAYMLVPKANTFLKGIFSGGILPLAGWTVAASAVVRVNAALALAGGSIASGELGVSGAVFALLLGSGLGTFTRILRMNAGYYFGFFPVRTARKMLLMNYMTIAPLVVVSILTAYICL